MLGVGCFDGQVKLVKADTGEVCASFQGHAGEVHCLALSPNGDSIVSGGADCTAQVWDVGSAVKRFELRESAPIPVEARLASTLVGTNAAVQSVCFSPSGHKVATGSEHGFVRIWSAETGEQQHLIPCGSSKVRAVAFSSSEAENVLAVGSLDRTVRVWEKTVGWKLARTLHGNPSKLSLVFGFSPDLTMVASQCFDGSVMVWESQDGGIVRTIPFADVKGWALAMAFSPDGRMLASSTWDRAVRLWDVATGKALQCLRGHDGEAPCRCRTFGLAHPDCPVSGHANYVLAVCFSPSSELLASGGEDRSVKIWNVANGSLLRTLHVRSEVLSLAFGRDWRSDQARLAVALALHPRLGSASRLNALEPEILRAILSDI